MQNGRVEFSEWNEGLGANSGRRGLDFVLTGTSRMKLATKKNGRSLGLRPFLVQGCGRIYWQPVKATLGVIATLVKGPVPVSASGGLEFTSEAVQVLVVIPSTA